MQKLNKGGAKDAAPATASKSKDAVDNSNPVEEPATDDGGVDLKSSVDAVIADHAAVRAVKAAAAQPATENAEDDGRVYFTSAHPSIVVYINVPGRSEIDRAGNRVPSSSPIEFKDGVYSTDDQTIAALLIERAQSMRQLFKRETDRKQLAVLRETFKEEALLKAGVVSGAATTGNDDAGEVVRAKAHLKKLRTAAFNAQAADDAEGSGTDV